MERNEETLSTRDLASPNEGVAEGRTADDDAGNGAVPEGLPGVHDQPREGTSRLPGEDEPQLAADERAGTSGSERAQPPATEQASAQPRPDGSASDQTLDALPDANPRTESGAPDNEPGDRPAEAAQAAETQEQDRGAAQPTSEVGVSPSDVGGSLLPAEMDATFQQRWKEIQTRFVDEPRGAVEDADSLVANLMQQLAEGFAKERERLEAQWGRGEDISTEDLRVALQRYRTFFQRLLST